jgi:hypothetical protein
MLTDLRYDPKLCRIYIKEDIRTILGQERGDVKALANAKTLTLWHPDEDIEDIIRSLKIVIQDLELRKDSADHAQADPRSNGNEVQGEDGEKGETDTA